MASPLTRGQETFAATLANLTGLNRNTVRAWVLAEMSSGPAQKREAQGNHNWLNIGYFDSGAAGWARQGWNDPVKAAKMSAQFLKGERWGAAQGIRDILKTAGRSPGEQLRAIWTSPWASSHYNNGASLRGTYKLVAGAEPPNVPDGTSSTATVNRGGMQSLAGRSATSGGTFLQTLMTGSVTGGQKAFREGMDSLIKQPPEAIVVGKATDGVQVAADTPVQGEVLQGIVSKAKKFLGTPYSWGGGNTKGPSKGFGRGANTVGFDCSSFIQYLYAQYGVNIPRVTYDQVGKGKKVGRNGLAPGDAVFFAHGNDVGHVGMYIGNGQFIHAPHSGDVIKISSLDDPYYKEHFYGGRRYV